MSYEFWSWEPEQERNERNAGDFLTLARKKLDESDAEQFMDYARGAMEGVGQRFSDAGQFVEQARSRIADVGSQAAETVSRAPQYGQEAAASFMEQARSRLEEPAQAAGDVLNESLKRKVDLSSPEAALESGREALGMKYPDISGAVTAGLERAGVPGHEEFGFKAGPVEVGPREVAGAGRN